jgi:hypothetical protein
MSGLPRVEEGQSRPRSRKAESASPICVSAPSSSPRATRFSSALFMSEAVISVRTELDLATAALVWPRRALFRGHAWGKTAHPDSTPLA